MKKIIVAVATILIIACGVAPLCVVYEPVVAATTICDDYNSNTDPNRGDPPPGCAPDTTGNAASARVNTILGVITGLLGLISTVFIIYGGFRYTTSAGDPKKVADAKNTILYAVVGLVVALLAFAIVQFVTEVLLKKP